MRNFNELVGQLNQDAPLFCEEAVLRIVVDLFLQKQKHIQNLIPIFRGFHTEKCLQHSIGKYIRSSALEESIRQTRAFGVKIVDSVLDVTHYVRSLKALLILLDAIKNLKWSLHSIKQFKVTA